MVLSDGCVSQRGHAAVAVMSGNTVYAVSFGGMKGSTTVAATAVMEISESLNVFWWHSNY